MVHSAHRLGDCAGRSPGSRVSAFRPAFPVSQWLMRTRGSPLTVAGAATAAARRDVEPIRVPSCLPGATRGTNTMLRIPRREHSVKISAGDGCPPSTQMLRAVALRLQKTRNAARCCPAATEYDGRPWHSGPACGPWGHRTPAAVTQAGYAYCQLRDTQLSVQTVPGHGPRDNGARVSHGRLCLGG